MVSTIRMADLAATRVSEAVVLACASVADADPMDVPPLGESINPIALDLLFEHDSFTGTVSFQYGEHEITVAADGTITVAG